MNFKPGLRVILADMKVKPFSDVEGWIDRADEASSRHWVVDRHSGILATAVFQKRTHHRSPGRPHHRPAPHGGGGGGGVGWGGGGAPGGGRVGGAPQW